MEEIQRKHQSNNDLKHAMSWVEFKRYKLDNPEKLAT
jgi:hypothetical protein